MVSIILFFDAPVFVDVFVDVPAAPYYQLNIKY